MHGQRRHYHDELGRTAYITRLRRGTVWTLAIRETSGHLDVVSRHRTKEAAYAALRASGDWEGVPAPGEE